MPLLLMDSFRNFSTKEIGKIILKSWCYDYVITQNVL